MVLWARRFPILLQMIPCVLLLQLKHGICDEEVPMPSIPRIHHTHGTCGENDVEQPYVHVTTQYSPYVSPVSTSFSIGFAT